MSEVIGQRIKAIRGMTEAEKDAEGWDFTMSDMPVVLVLENGAKLYPSQDPEGNGPGCMFGVDETGQTITLCPPQEG